jgi:hypothetical protein
MGSNPIGVIANQSMPKESIFLKSFLSNIGDAVHALNTVCVGLSSVADKTARKPDDLVVTWDPKDPIRSSQDARLFAVKATYVFAAESIYEYINSIKPIFFLSASDIQSFDALDNADKVKRILEYVHTDNHIDEYRLILAKLMIHTRNKIVHKRSNASLSANERTLLIENAELIASNHSGLSITQTLENFESKRYTLKDVSSHVANIIHAARKLDNRFVNNIHDGNLLLKVIESSRLRQEWDTISSMRELDLKERKINRFVKLNFSFLQQQVLDKILSDLLAI